MGTRFRVGGTAHPARVILLRRSHSVTRGVSAADGPPSVRDRFLLLYLTGYTSYRNVVDKLGFQQSPPVRLMWILKSAAGRGKYMIYVAKHFNDKWAATNPVRRMAPATGMYLQLVKSEPAHGARSVVMLPPPVVWVTLDGCVHTIRLSVVILCLHWYLTGEEPMDGRAHNIVWPGR